jgi:hypothetical protein
MSLVFEAEQIPADIYRLSKEQLLEFLSRYGIKYKDEDTVAELRPVVASLKAFLKTELTEEKKYLFRELVSRKQYLSEGQPLKYPILAKIEKFIKERENLYDTPDLDETEHQYEEVRPRTPLGILSFPPPYNIDNTASQSTGKVTPKADTVNIQENTPKMSKEKLPLISAGTFHGLPSENPNDFTDKYEIAAISNHWSDQTRLNLFPAYLAGTALAWYQHYSKGRDITDWEQLKKVFIATFTPAAQAQTLQAILEKKVQGRDQPVLSYFLEVMTLCKRHDPDIKDKQIIQYVIHGLRPEYCELILNETCDTVQQLEERLKKIELHIQIRALNKEKFERAESKVGTKQNTNTDTHEEKLSNIEATLNELTQAVSHLKLQNAAIPGRGHKQDTSRDYYGGRGNWGNYHRGPRDFRQNNTFHNRGGWGHSVRQQGPYYQGNNRPSWNEGKVNYHQRPQASQNSSYDKSRGHGGRGDMYCTYCNRNNHNTNDCRYNRAKRGALTQNKNMYCDHCKMTNHSRDNCFRLKSGGHGSKNE